MRLLFVFGLLLIFSTLNAQLVEIDGRVFDNKGEPLVGTTLIVKRKWSHASTDDKGSFRMAVTKGDTIEFSHVGYSDFRYTVTRAGTIDIELKKQPFVLSQSGKSRVRLAKIDVSAGRLTKETLNNSIIEESRVDSITKANKYIFMKVQIDPALSFSGSPETIFSHGIKNKLVKRKDILELQFVISRDKTIENIHVLKSYNNDVDQLVIENFKTAFICYPAIQNGIKINADCQVSFSIYRDEGNVQVKIINAEKP